MAIQDVKSKQRSCKTCGVDITSRPHFALYCAEHSPVKKGKTGKSMRAAINAKCRDCIYDPVDRGTWLQQVTACEITDCPLYPYRPTTVVRIAGGEHT